MDPCGVCGEQVGYDSVQFMKCQRLVRCHCSHVRRQMSLPSCPDVFVCRICLGHNCSVEEKLEFKRGENVLEEAEKFC